MGSMISAGEVIPHSGSGGEGAGCGCIMVLGAFTLFAGSAFVIGQAAYDHFTGSPDKHITVDQRLRDSYGAQNIVVDHNNKTFYFPGLDNAGAPALCMGSYHETSGDEYMDSLTCGRTTYIDDGYLTANRYPTVATTAVPLSEK